MLKMRIGILVFLPVFLSAQSAGAGCKENHEKATQTCAAHEHSLNADALTIVSLDTRERVAHREESKLESMRDNCIKAQETCALSCDEEVETASLDGRDLAQPLDLLTDCRQGEIAKQLKVMNRKLSDLRRVIKDPRKAPASVQALKNASNR
jgi:hypothetical protein